VLFRGCMVKGSRILGFWFFLLLYLALPLRGKRLWNEVVFHLLTHFEECEFIRCCYCEL
jgi:hypothetical protein